MAFQPAANQAPSKPWNTNKEIEIVAIGPLLFKNFLYIILWNIA